MFRKQKMFTVVVMALLLAFVAVGCSKSTPGPTDADALKILQTAVEAGLKGQTLKSPVVIVEKGEKLPTGDWPFKVEYTVANPDGTDKKVTAKFNLSPTVTDMGVNTFNAIEAK